MARPIKLEKRLGSQVARLWHDGRIGATRHFVRSDMTSKELEREALHRVLESCSDLKWDSVEDSESPDFLLRQGERRVGIEVTRYSPQRKSIGFIAEEQDSLRERVVNYSRDVYYRAGSHPLHVQVIFNDHRAVQSARVRALANELAAHLLSAPFLVPMFTSLPLDRSDNYRDFEEVTNVSAYKVPTRSMGAWYAGKGSFVRDAGTNDFARVLHVKEPKLLDYRKRCDQVCLVVVFEMMAGGEYVQPPFESRLPNLETGFDRIFAVERVRGGCIELCVQSTEARD